MSTMLSWREQVVVDKRLRNFLCLDTTICKAWVTFVVAQRHTGAMRLRFNAQSPVASRRVVQSVTGFVFVQEPIRDRDHE